jgi:hypothetical protein
LVVALLGEVFMAKRKFRNDEIPSDELENDSEGLASDSAEESRSDEVSIDDVENDSEELASDSAGQSGDTQGLSHLEDIEEETVEELVETDQAYEAEIEEGVEDAGDHPERPVQTREDKARYDSE